MRSKFNTALIAPFILHCSRIDKYAMKKFSVHGQRGNKYFFIVIYCFLLVKAVMNVPRVCKLRKTILPALTQCAMMLSKKYK
jgi:hypothetical protein